MVISILQIIKVFAKDDNDTNEEDPMMNEISPDNKNDNSIEYDQGYQVWGLIVFML